MITISKFKILEEEAKKNKIKFTEFHLRVLPTDRAEIQQFADEHGISLAAAIRYFCLLGMEAHQKRKKYNEEQKAKGQVPKSTKAMIREEIIKEFERRLELSD